VCVCVCVFCVCVCVCLLVPCSFSFLFSSMLPHSSLFFPLFPPTSMPSQLRCLIHPVYALPTTVFDAANAARCYYFLCPSNTVFDAAMLLIPILLCPPTTVRCSHCCSLLHLLCPSNYCDAVSAASAACQCVYIPMPLFSGCFAAPLQLAMPSVPSALGLTS